MGAQYSGDTGIGGWGDRETIGFGFVGWKVVGAGSVFEGGFVMRERKATVADVEGPWVDVGFESGLVERCKRGWDTPVVELTNELLATYLRQKVALSLLVPEARKRIAEKFVDGTERYDDELANALKSATDVG
jgi:hypothetical protein